MENMSGIDFGGPPPFILLANPPVLVYLYRYGLPSIFLLGLIGNTSSMMTFLRPVLRATSTGFLFFLLAISDSLFLLTQIYDFIEVGILDGPLFLSHYGDLCRFRWFTKGLFQFCSGWILALVAIDRWLRARVPFKVNALCTRRNMIIAISIVIILGCCIHCHLLISSIFGGLTPGISNEACGPVNPFGEYANFYFGRWPIVQAILNCLIPVATMLASGFDISRVIRKERQRVQPGNVNRTTRQRQDRIQAQMLLLTIASVSIFFFTTLPVSIRRVIGAYEIAVFKMTNLFNLVTHNGSLTVLSCLNYAINFYVHCLASQLFRQEFFRCVFKREAGISGKMTRTLTVGQQRAGIGGSTTNHMPTIE